MQGKGEPPSQISRSKVISFKSYFPRQETHTYPTEVVALPGPLKWPLFLCRFMPSNTLLNTLFDVMRQRLNVHALLVHELHPISETAV